MTDERFEGTPGQYIMELRRRLAAVRSAHTLLLRAAEELRPYKDLLQLAATDAGPGLAFNRAALGVIAALDPPEPVDDWPHEELEAWAGALSATEAERDFWREQAEARAELVGMVVTQRDQLRDVVRSVTIALDTVTTGDHLDIPGADARDIIARCHAAIREAALKADGVYDAMRGPRE